MVDDAVLVARTATGPIYRVEQTVVTCSWTVGLHVLSELARKTLDPEAPVASSIARDLSGGGAFLAHCHVLGSMVEQARTGGTVKAAVIATTMLAYLEDGHDPVGLEGLFMSVTNRLYGRVTPELTDALLQATYRILRESAWSRTMPTYVMQSGGAVSPFDSLYVEQLDDDWLKKSMQEARARGKAKLVPVPSSAVKKAIREVSQKNNPLATHKKKLTDMFGDGWGQFAVDDLGGGGTHGIGTSPWAGLPAPSTGMPGGGVPHEEQLDDKDRHLREAQKRRLDREDWATDPFSPDDITRPQEREAGAVGDVVRKAGDLLNKAGKEVEKVGRDLTGVGLAAAAASVATGPGAVVTFPIAQEIEITGLTIMAVGKVWQGAGGAIHWVGSHMWHSEDPTKDPIRPKKSPMDGIWSAYPHLTSPAKIRKAFPKGPGFSKVQGPPPGVDDANVPGSTFVPIGQFTVVNPLDDPLDMLLPDERRPLKEPPKHVVPDQLHPKIYYVGSGTIAGLLHLPNGTIVRG